LLDFQPTQAMEELHKFLALLEQELFTPVAVVVEDILEQLFL
jgi:hypothetical protein